MIQVMKKQILFAALLAGAACFVGCKGNDPDKPTGDVTITINPHEVVLTEVEPSVRLSATLSPADASATVVWSSSDTTIAVVTNRGVVDAVAYGECYIYASVGEAKDSCHVSVKTYMEALLFTGAFVGDADTTYALDPETGEYKVDTIKASSGETYYAYKALATLDLFSDGFYVNNSGHLDGTEQGVIIEIQAPMYYATAYLNNRDKGTLFCLGEWGVTDDIQYMKEGHPGKISDEAEYVNQMKQFVAAFNANEDYSTYLKAAGELFEGATLNSYEYNAEAEGYYGSYIPDAVCDEAIVSLNDVFPASKYMCGIDYCVAKYTPLDYTFGMKIEENEDETLSLVDEDIHWSEQITSIYGELPSADEAAALKAIQVPVISENPALKASLEKQMQDKNVRVFRFKH